jgi:hypothetical protein
MVRVVEEGVSVERLSQSALCRVDDGHMKYKNSQESFTRNQNYEKKNLLGRLFFFFFFLKIIIIIIFIISLIFWCSKLVLM